MRFTSIFASGSLLALAIAQDTPIAFTSTPAVAEIGETYNITWGGGDGTPVTLTLRKGDARDLSTIGILADGIRDDFYEWEVADDLDSANDYALQITQGQGNINYSGLFSVLEGSGSSNSSSNSTSNSTTTASGNSTSTATDDDARPTGDDGNSTTTESATSTTTDDSEPTESTTTTRTSATTTASSTSTPTSAPDSNSGAMQLGSSAAFAVAVLGAVVFLN